MHCQVCPPPCSLLHRRTNPTFHSATGAANGEVALLRRGGSGWCTREAVSVAAATTVVAAASAAPAAAIAAATTAAAATDAAQATAAAAATAAVHRKSRAERLLL